LVVLRGFPQDVFIKEAEADPRGLFQKRQLKLNKIDEVFSSVLTEIRLRKRGVIFTERLGEIVGPKTSSGEENPNV
jgi:hypothetical protein